ncbi:hypothetical protein ERO13_D08G273700v2 [Gossypium hirsutum]|uniref:Uncharacterized protein n=2 Tax=Gossypium TaxID=3633 RepID=A0A5J5QS21_GOSBA|nr:hypothetical protein ES319_D08G302200v1 [Gossypium barbadense]KAG4136317.1 hypothetical protein ERO13_D08G273700v2 [Gossypium hirsutum]TYG59586.1 hypothetical protein ES288_D08G314900v1 [Gossypium darwinii]
MKKMKGVAASVEYSPYPIYEDQRNRFKHHSLMQDFDDLFKETEAMRKRLQVLKDKKLTLLAEVRFLKRRHKFLMQNRTSNTPAEQSFAHSQNKVIRSKLNTEEKKSTGKEHTLGRLATGFDLNQKTEEEEVQASNNSMGVEELKRSSLRIGSDEQHNDIKLSACWNTGNGPNRVGKRKITWQDQVALKV